MNTITVIGGSGFIGTRFCRLLEKDGVDFLIIDKDTSLAFGPQSVAADVRNGQVLQKAVSGQVIINLAAEHRDDVTPRSLYDEVNVDGARRVCAAAEAKGIEKIIFTSSVAVYGFAPVGTDESGELNPFNDYGRTKMLAEQVYREWQSRDPENRTLVIVRPTVVFGEGNRGNVYNLLRQIASGLFVMIGNGKNVKSMAYVENVAAFLVHCLDFGPGVHVYNYVDKPDLNMNQLVDLVYKTLGRKPKIKARIPYFVGYNLAKVFDLAARVTGKKFPISSIRVKKFCSNSCFDTSVAKTGFTPPVPLLEGLERTIRHEFIEKHDGEVFHTE